MKNYIVCIASEFKGMEFLEECQNQGWHVTLITRRKMLKEAWPWTSLNDVRPVDDDAAVLEYARTITNIAGEHPVHRVVGLDEFDVITAAKTREHMQLGGMTISHALRFRDKLAMRNIATAAGIPCPQFSGGFNKDGINEFLDRASLPLIVKPRNEVSAFGIRKCESREEVWSTLEELDRKNTWRDHPSQYLIEEFIEGNVFHVDSVVRDGKVVAQGVSAYGTPPFAVTHYGGVFTTSIVPYQAKERKELEELNARLLEAFNYKRGVSHAEFLHSDKDGKFYLLEVAARVGGAYISNVLEHACNFNLWREWAKLETETDNNPYNPPKTRKEFAGIALCLANQEHPDTSHYTDKEIVYRVNKPRHIGLIFRAKSQKRIEELLQTYREKITQDFLATAPAKMHYDE